MHMPFFELPFFESFRFQRENNRMTPLFKAMTPLFKAMMVALLCAWAGLAQLDNATILGTVFDATGGVVPGAKVDVHNQGTSATVSRTTDASGNFIAPSSPVGSYRITVSYPGFKTNVREKVAINSADRLRLEITLEPGEVTERVMVASDAPLIE